MPNNTFKSHEEIADFTRLIVDGNLKCEYAHNRENLEDIIEDLIRYRDSLPSIKQYLDANEL
jgi:hypothetical protein